MFEGYEKVKNAVDGVIINCENVCKTLDINDEYDGVLRIILKSQCRYELIHRCAMLILEGLPEDDLRELFSDEIYDDALDVFEHASHVWNKRNGAIS